MPKIHQTHKQHNKHTVQFVSYVLLVFMLGMAFFVQPGKAEWTPGDNELGPAKDTFVSIGAGYFDEPLSNFGGAETLYVGDGLYGICVSAIQFDLADLPATADSLQFLSSIVVYGETTRTLEIYILVGDDWDELAVTGLDNPFNASGVFLSDGVGNLTSVTLTGSTSELTVDLADYLTETGLITLIFTTGIFDESWFTMASQENQYLSSLSDPPRLAYTVPVVEEEPSGSGGAIGALIVIAIVVGVVVMKKKKKKNVDAQV